MPVQPIDLNKLDEYAANIYEAAIVCAKRARVINDENKIEFNAMLSTVPAAGSEDEVEDIENPAQLNVALEFEKKEKPHIQALSEFLEGKVEYNYIEL